MSDETQFPTFDASRVIGPQTDIPIPDEIGGFRILSLLGAALAPAKPAP